jgi:hypothetical protein
MDHKALIDSWGHQQKHTFLHLFAAHRVRSWDSQERSFRRVERAATKHGLQNPSRTDILGFLHDFTQEELIEQRDDSFSEFTTVEVPYRVGHVLTHDGVRLQKEINQALSYPQLPMLKKARMQGKPMLSDADTLLIALRKIWMSVQDVTEFSGIAPSVLGRCAKQLDTQGLLKVKRLKPSLMYVSGCYRLTTKGRVARKFLSQLAKMSEMYQP